MKHYNKYKELIRTGDIVINNYIKQVLDKIEYLHSKYIFKQEEVNRRIEFIENECSHFKGATGKLKLELVQKVWLEAAWGFYKDNGQRLINEIALIVSRGSGKTTLAAAIAYTMQIIDGEQGAEIQLLAYDRTQAGYIFEANRAMLKKQNTLIGLLNKAQILKSTKKGIMYETTNSLLSIKTSDYNSLDGTNAHCNIFDEVHTYRTDFLKIVKDGSSRKRKNWQSWYISTNGVVRDAVLDKYLSRWKKILDGELADDSVLPFIYSLDEVEEIHDEKNWQKAMPLLDITTTREVIKKDIENAKDDPVEQAELMAKTFNLPVNNYLAYFTNEEATGNAQEFKQELFKGTDEKHAKVIMGIDLSDVNDICSISLMTIKKDKYYFKNFKFTPQLTVDKLPLEQKNKYYQWQQDKELIIHDKDYNDQKYIFDYINKYITENKITPIKIGYDRWNAREIIRYFTDYYGEIAEDVPQTVKGLSNHLKLYKQIIKAGKIAYKDEVSRWNHLNVMVKVDANGNIFPNKERSRDKIDVFASQLDAFAVYQNNKEVLEYYYN